MLISRLEFELPLWNDDVAITWLLVPLLFLDETVSSCRGGSYPLLACLLSWIVPDRL